MHPTFDLPNPQVVDKELKGFIVVNKGCCYRKYQTRKQQIYICFSYDYIIYNCKILRKNLNLPLPSFYNTQEMVFHCYCSRTREGPTQCFVVVLGCGFFLGGGYVSVVF